MRKNYFRFSAALFAAAALIFCMTGCGANAGQGGSVEEGQAQEEETKSTAEQDAEAKAQDPTEEDITLTFWYTYGDNEEAQLLNAVIPLWEEKHPNIKIETVRQDDSQYHQMIVTSFGTGMSPDVARVDITNVAAYANQGGLVALSDFEDFTSISPDFLDGPLSTGLYKGKYYGLPLDTNCKAAVVNTNILAKLGLNEVPDTMEEFIEAAANRGDYSLNVSGVGDWDMYPYFWLFGGTLTNDDFTQASGYLDSDASIAAIKEIIELHDNKILTIRDIDGTADAWDGINSDYAMFFEGPWYFGSYEDREEMGIVAATIPTYEGRSASVVGGEDIVVFSTSKHPVEAYEFAKFMTSPDVQLAMLQSGQLPVLKSLVNDKAVLDNPVWSVYMKQLESAGARIPSPNNSQIQEIWSDTITNIFVNGADVETELHQAAELIDGQLN